MHLTQGWQSGIVLNMMFTFSSVSALVGFGPSNASVRLLRSLDGTGVSTPLRPSSDSGAFSISSLVTL